MPLAAGSWRLRLETERRLPQLQQHAIVALANADSVAYVARVNGHQAMACRMATQPAVAPMDLKHAVALGSATEPTVIVAGDATSIAAAAPLVFVVAAAAVVAVVVAAADKRQQLLARIVISGLRPRRRAVQ